MKRGEKISLIFFISIFLIFLSIELISASDFEIRLRTDCQTAPWDNIIMGLSDTSNAHGQVWNASTYTGISDYSYVLCSDKTGNHDCSTNSHPVYGAGIPKNKIIGLSSINDAHGEGTSGSLYTTNICYQGLVCQNVTDTCPSDYPLDIFNLSSPTNAHIGTGLGYGTAICCQYTGLAGDQCSLVNATFGYSSTTENGAVPAIVEGTNCPSTTAINYSIWKINYNFLGVETGSDLYNWSIGTFDREMWTAKLSGTDPRDTFYFKADTLITDSIFSSRDGTGNTNKTLVVSQQAPDYCADKLVCDSYKDSQNCSQDPCNPKAATIDPSCPGTGYTCECTWNSGTSKCELSSSPTPPPELVCKDGTTKCYAGGIAYCYPGNTCPPDATHTSCSTGTCTLVSGSGTNDCNIVGQSCTNPPTHSVCANQQCIVAVGAGSNACSADSDCPPTPVTHSQCNSVTGMCEVVSGAGDNQCQVVSQSCSNPIHAICANQQCIVAVGAGPDACSVDSDCGGPGNGVCDNQDGCTSPDCHDGDTDSCESPGTCLGGTCNVPGEIPGNETNCNSGYTLCYNRTAGYTFCYPGNTCRTGEEPLSNNNGKCEVNEGCSSADCACVPPTDCSTMTDSCAVGSYCQQGACFSPLSVDGKCIFHETSTNDCAASGNLEYSWTVDWTGDASEQPSYCVDGSKVAPCAAQATLPFFGTYQIIGAILLIIIIYLSFMYRKKMKKHSRTHKKK